MAKIKPLGDRVVLKQLQSEEVTKSGIVIPEAAKEKPVQGEIIAVGQGKVDDGKRVPLEVKVGDKVLYSKYGPTEVKVDNKEYLIVREEDILAVLEQEPSNPKH